MTGASFRICPGAFSRPIGRNIPHGRIIRHSGGYGTAAAASWPGNVRELENELERAALLAEGPDIGPGDLSPVVGYTAPPDSGCTPPPESPDLVVASSGSLRAEEDSPPTLAAVEGAHIRAVLRIMLNKIFMCYSYNILR